MRRFTLTIAMVSIVAFAFGQRSINQMRFSSEKVSGKQIMTYPGDKSISALTVVFEEDFTDSVVAPAVNGLPDYFSYTPNSTERWDQWQWHSFTSGETAMTMWPDPGHPILESAIADLTVATGAGVTVPTSNPGLFFDFEQSYYWSVTQGDDSLCVYYSIDDGANWNMIWNTYDSALVAASGLEADWGNFGINTARVILPAECFGTMNLKLKFDYQGAGSPSTLFFLYNFSIVELPDYDIAMESYVPHTFYYKDGNLDSARADGIYQQLPIAQKRNFEYFRSRAKSYGALSTPGMNITHTLTDTTSGTIICTKDTAIMNGGGSSLVIYQKDTFETEGFLAADFANVAVGTYALKGMISHDNIADDANPTDQEWMMNIDYVANSYEGSGATTYLSRNTSIDGDISPSNYGGASGDKIGISFTVSESCSATGALIPLGVATDQAGFLIAIYGKDVNDDWIQIGFTADHYCADAESNTTIDLDLQNDVELEAGKEYLMMAIPSWTAGSSEVNFANFSGYNGRENGLAVYASSLHLGTSWWVIYSVPSFTVKLRNNQAVNVETTLEDVVKVYPNPTNGTLHIDNVNGATVEVYNMVGTMVDVINNASDFNTVNLSNYAEGTYLVKVYTESGIVIKKVNLVK